MRARLVLGLSGVIVAGTDKEAEVARAVAANLFFPFVAGMPPNGPVADIAGRLKGCRVDEEGADAGMEGREKAVEAAGGAVERERRGWAWPAVVGGRRVGASLSINLIMCGVR